MFPGQKPKVVVVAHAYGECRGVRYLTNGLKVYYLSRRAMYQQTTFPTLFGVFPLFRQLLLRERISLVHVHGAFSTLALETALVARTMGYAVVFSDHSLFGFSDHGSIFQNKVLKCVLADTSHCVCVSHTSRENTVLRACLPPARVSVIPNAVDSKSFYPAAVAATLRTSDASTTSSTDTSSLVMSFPPVPAWPRDPHTDKIVIVLLSRLVYRKGLDLVALALPHVLTRHPNVEVIIGGGGPKTALLTAMCELHGLQDRVTFVGPVPSEAAPDFLRRGHIFLNSSLTEAFCMALLEAAATGLMVVSTAVGGVPEVLPRDCVELCPPTAEGLVAGLEAAIQRVVHVDPVQQHNRIKGMYSWSDVADRTSAMYTRVMKQHAAAWATAAAAPTSKGCRTATGAAAVAHQQQLDDGNTSHVDGSSASDPDLSDPSVPDPEYLRNPGVLSDSDYGCWGWTPPIPAQQSRLLLYRLLRYIKCGTAMGPLMCIYAVWLHWWWCIVDWFLPVKCVDVAADWPSAQEAMRRAGSYRDCLS